MFNLRVAGAALLAWSVFAAIPSGDARRGEQLFTSQRCVQCHSVNGRGGSAAPDLVKTVDRDFTPTVMASLMWNHAPAMWASMEKSGVPRQALTPEQSADLFAFFVSARYFDKPGDAGRGKQAFTTKHCAECHGITTASYPGAPPVAKWESLADPIILAQQMWNHGPRMRQAFAEKKLQLVQLSGQELTDILVYLRNVPETKQVVRDFRFSAASGGEALFQSKGCAGCHAGANALVNKLRTQTPTEIAADMWNHQPSMKNPPPELSPDEMRQILSYIWAEQYFSGNGNAARGKKVFSDKNCASCHTGGGAAPNLAKGKGAYSDITMVSSLWQHGPHMLEAMEKQKKAWPRFDTPQQMADLIAYLNSQ